MLKLRIIPCLDVKDGRVVKGVNFVDLRDAAIPWNRRPSMIPPAPTKLTFLDITASHENRDTILSVVSRTASRIFLPLTVGGGVRTTDDMRRLLLAGADKCSMNSAACARPELVREAAHKFGSQCVVVAIEAARGRGRGLGSLTHGGRTRTGRDVVTWAQEVESLGAGEILLNSMDRDGTGRRLRSQSFDCNRCRREAAYRGLRWRCTIEHFHRGRASSATGLLAASVFSLRHLHRAQVKKTVA